MKKGLLLGAGFSYDLGMPLIKELTEVFLALFNPINAKNITPILASKNPFGNNRPINAKAITEVFDLLLHYKANQGNNYEDFLSTLQDLGKGERRTQSDRDSYHYLFGVFYEIIHNVLSVYQVVSYDILYKHNMQYFSQLPNLLSDDETWIFTLNHDLYLECIAIDLKIPITYGDVGFKDFNLNNLEMDKQVYFTYSERNNVYFGSSCFFSGANGINIIKIHGGLSEYDYDDRQVICNLSLNHSSSSGLINAFRELDRFGYFYRRQKVLSGGDVFIPLSGGQCDVISKSMLTGGYKYSKTSQVKKGEEKLKLFDDVLCQLDKLTIIGYGFMDRHINFRISNAMVLNKNLTVWIIDPSTKFKHPEFLEQFDYDSRVRRAYCGAAPWMNYCKSEKWDYEQINKLKENTTLREKIRKNVEAILPSGW